MMSGLLAPLEELRVGPRTLLDGICACYVRMNRGLAALAARRTRSHADGPVA